jgi:hypothetical protein
MRIATISALLIVAIFSISAHADYTMAPIEVVVQELGVTIIDASVSEITKDGHAKINIHETLKGKNAPTLLKSVALSCTGPTVKQAGVKKGKRYIFVLAGEDIYEGSTYWEILKGFDGELKCYFRCNSRAPKDKMPALRMPQNGLYSLNVFKRELRNVAKVAKK